MPNVPRRQPLAAALVGLIAAVKIAAHVATNVATPYGFHRDEFLYMAMGRHLQLWRMEFPPAIAILAELSRAGLGDSLVSVRLVPALAGGALVVLAALIARELGGGRYAQGLGALAVLASPLFLRASNLFQPVVLDQLWWTVGLYALLQVGRAEFQTRHAAGATRWWVLLGVAGGVALLTKFSALFFGFAVLVAILVTPLRAVLRTGRPWIALLLALAIGSPSVVGQIRLGAPVLGQMRDLRSTQLERVTAPEFLSGQLLLGPAIVLAAAGLLFLLRADSMRPYRAAGWACAVAFVTLLALHGKPYYVGPIYPLLFAAGATTLEAATTGAGIRSVGTRGRRSTTRVLAPLLVAAYGVLTLPYGLPLLPPALMARYAAATGVAAGVKTNRGELLPLPQDYADMLGWEEQVATVARVYRELPDDRRRQAVVLAANYGQAGAIDFFGPRHGLPGAVSPAGTYWFFGPGDAPGHVAVAIGIPGDQLQRFFASVTEAERITNAWAVPEESNVAVYVAERPFQTLQAVWPSLAGRN